MIEHLVLILNILTPLFYIGAILLLGKRLKELENHSDFITKWMSSLEKSTTAAHKDLYLTIAKTQGMIPKPGGLSVRYVDGATTKIENT